MSLVDDIRNQAFPNGKGSKTIEEMQLEKIFNAMFYKNKNIEEEVKFVKQVMTRGLESQERAGLHASAMIVGDKQFCIRQQVLSLLYKQLQGEQVNADLMRIFEQGNAIHEKWQRLFIRAGYAKAEDCDLTRFDKKYEMSFTPDVIVTIPEFYPGPMVVEIKSVNTYQFQKMEHHSSGEKQCQFYMNRTGLKKGLTLCEDKNTQQFKIRLLDYDSSITDPFVERLEEVKYYKNKAIKEHKMVKRHCDCKSADCKMASQCPMKDACWNIGIGRIKLK